MPLKLAPKTGCNSAGDSAPLGAALALVLVALRRRRR
jgi:uncharacterized protein (TIGR03382 family)